MWDEIRKLAFNWKYQTLYRASERLNIKIYNNDIDFSRIQLYFMHWQIIYNGLYERLSYGDDEHLTEAVIKDTYRTDAYLYCESIQDKKKVVKNSIEKHKSNRVDENHPESFEFVFLKPNSKEKK